MTEGWLQQDLLGQRRKLLGLTRPQAMPVRRLLMRGALIGSALPLLAAITFFVLFMRDRWLASEQQRLKPQADAHDRLEQRLNSVKIDAELVQQSNFSLAKAMAEVRSSSALLYEIARILPSQIVLDAIKSNGDQIEIQGQASEPKGLNVVNAYMLSLSESKFFIPSDVRLKKAEYSTNTTSASMSFDLGAGFAADAAKSIRPELAGLGATGLARRVLFLENEGLLP